MKKKNLFPLPDQESATRQIAWIYSKGYGHHRGNWN